ADGFRDTRSRADTAVLPEHGAAHVRTGPDLRSGSDDDVLQRGACSDLDIRSEQHGAATAYLAPDHGAALAPDRATASRPLLPTQPELHLASQDVIVRAAVLFDVADVTPIAFGDVTEQRGV